MTDFWNLLISFTFCILCYTSTGYAIKRFFHLSCLTFAEYFLLGAGIISIATLFLSMFFPEFLHFTSLTFMSLGLISGAIAIFTETQKEGIFKDSRKWILGLLILFIMILPLLVGALHVRFWGDELGMEGTMVRYWLQSRNFLVDPGERFSFYGYPRLWVIMIYQTLCLNGVLHEAAGRWLTIFIVFCGSLFVWKEYFITWRLNKWLSIAWSSFWMTLVFGPMFAWSASWYYSTTISVLVMMSFYFAITAHNTQDGSLDLKRITVSAVLMAMIVGIRPDGFLYIPLMILLLFAVPKKEFSGLLRRNLQAILVIISITSLLFLSWHLYVIVNKLHIIEGRSIVNPLEIAGRIERLWFRFLPVTTEMLKKIITQWNQSGVWFASLSLCSFLGYRLYGNLDFKEKRLLLLLTVPLYKFFLMIIESSLFFEVVKGRMGRHIMQTAPILYFLLGFLCIKWVKIKFGHYIEQWSNRIRLTVFSSLLVGVFFLQFSIGSLFACLPSGMNDYMEDWVVLIRNEQPEYRRVLMLFSSDAPPTTRIHPTWRFYANVTPNIYSTLPSSIKYMPGNIVNKFEYLDFLHRGKVDAVLIYGADAEICNFLELELDDDKTYLLEVGDWDLRIVTYNKIPYPDKWMVPWRTKAINTVVRNFRSTIGF
jgi:hypothetical protein